VGGDGHIAGGVGHAGQHEAVAHLAVIQEALVALVNGTGLNLAGAAGAGTCRTAAAAAAGNRMVSKEAYEENNG
jgi:hypothetical protein